MSVELLLALCAAFFAIAILYSSVGHAGASGYLAVMSLAGVAAATMRPAALALNILVASFTVYRFGRAGYFRWRNLWPFLVGSVPGAAIGGAWVPPTRVYYYAVGAALLLSACVLTWRAVSQGRAVAERLGRQVPIPPAVGIGAGIGVLSGLTGTGGGIFLSPVVLLAGWASPRETSGIAAPFILANSTTALLAGTLSWATLPRELPWLALAVFCGALVGTWLGIEKLSTRWLLALMAVVLVLASGKLFLTAWM